MHDVTTSVAVRGKRLLLRREWLYGRRAWAVFHNGVKLGWVLHEDWKLSGARWAYVLPPENEEDIYDDILYDFDTRVSALHGLVPKEPAK